MLHFKSTDKDKYEVTQVMRGTVHFVYTVKAKSKEEALTLIENKTNDPNYEPLEEADKVTAHPDYEDTSSFIVKKL